MSLLTIKDIEIGFQNGLCVSPTLPDGVTIQDLNTYLGNYVSGCQGADLSDFFTFKSPKTEIKQMLARWKFCKHYDITKSHVTNDITTIVSDSYLSENNGVNHSVGITNIVSKRMGVCTITGDYGDWIACRNFVPTNEAKEYGVSVGYFAEKVRIANQNTKTSGFDSDTTEQGCLEKIFEFYGEIGEEYLEKNIDNEEHESISEKLLDILEQYGKGVREPLVEWISDHFELPKIKHDPEKGRYVLAESVSCWNGLCGVFEDYEDNENFTTMLGYADQDWEFIKDLAKLYDASDEHEAIDIIRESNTDYEYFPTITKGSVWLEICVEAINEISRRITILDKLRHHKK